MKFQCFTGVRYSDVQNISKEDISNGVWMLRTQKTREIIEMVVKENEVLLRIGAYQKGSDKELDEAIEKKEKMDEFLKQSPNELFGFEEIKNMLFNTI